MSDILEWHRRVMAASSDVVGRLGTEQLELATPCSDWDVRGLLEHMIGQNCGFGAAATQRVDAAAFASRPLGPDPAGEYVTSAEFVVTAFATPGVLERHVYLAEIRGGVQVPASVAVGFHLVDYVVHSWDVAVAIGAPLRFDEDVLAAALRVAEMVPDDAQSRAPGASFAPAVSIEGGDTLDRILALLGRDPSWQQA